MWIRRRSIRVRFIETVGGQLSVGVIGGTSLGGYAGCAEFRDRAGAVGARDKTRARIIDPAVAEILAP